MASQTIIVDPVQPGFAFSGAFTLVGLNGANPGIVALTGVRVIADVRAYSDTTGALLAHLDTTGGTLVVVGPYTLQFNMTAAQTLAVVGDFVFIDFVRLDGATPQPMPLKIKWPVKKTVTAAP